MKSYLRAHIARLRAQVEEQNRQHALRQVAAHPAMSNRQLKGSPPLDAQIVGLLRTLPPQLRNRPWSMAELVQRLSGKYRDRPHAQHVGETLRRLGWQRVRLWKAGADGQRVWVPR